MYSKQLTPNPQHCCGHMKDSSKRPLFSSISTGRPHSSGREFFWIQTSHFFFSWSSDQALLGQNNSFCPHSFEGVMMTLIIRGFMFQDIYWTVVNLFSGGYMVFQFRTRLFSLTNTKPLVLLLFKWGSSDSKHKGYWSLRSFWMFRQLETWQKYWHSVHDVQQVHGASQQSIPCIWVRRNSIAHLKVIVKGPVIPVPWAT